MSCITCLPNSSSSSSSADRIFNEKPSGAFDCINLTYSTSNVFDPDTLIVRLDGIALDPEQYIIDVSNQSFTLIVDSTDAKALNTAPCNDECLRVDYTKPSSGTTTSSGCITFL